MATGDKKNAIEKLRTELLNGTKFDFNSDKWNVYGMENGDPTSCMKVLRFIVLEYSHSLATYFTSKGWIVDMTDDMFMDSVFKLIARLCKKKPVLSLAQFFKPEYAEHKALMCSELLKKCKEFKEQLTKEREKKKAGASVNQEPSVLRSSLQSPPLRTEGIEAKRLHGSSGSASGGSGPTATKLNSSGGGARAGASKALTSSLTAKAAPPSSANSAVHPQSSDLAGSNSTQPHGFRRDKLICGLALKHIRPLLQASKKGALTLKSDVPSSVDASVGAPLCVTSTSPTPTAITLASKRPVQPPPTSAPTDGVLQPTVFGRSNTDTPNTGQGSPPAVKPVSAKRSSSVSPAPIAIPHQPQGEFVSIEEFEKLLQRVAQLEVLVKHLKSSHHPKSTQQPSLPSATDAVDTHRPASARKMEVSAVPTCTACVSHTLQASHEPHHEHHSHVSSKRSPSETVNRGLSSLRSQNLDSQRNSRTLINDLNSFIKQNIESAPKISPRPPSASCSVAKCSQDAIG